MKYFVILFLFTGLIIAITDIIKYKYNLYVINNFEKLVLDFKIVISQENINMSEADKILKLLLKEYPFYSNSNIQIVFVPDYALKQNILITSHWLFNADKYFKNSSGYPFIKLLEYVDNTLKECALSKGNNRFEIHKSYLELIPIYYFRNCFNFVISQFPISKEKVIQNKNWWINFSEIISVLAGIVALVDFMIRFFFSDV